MPITINGTTDARVGFTTVSVGDFSTNFDGTHVAPADRTGSANITLGGFSASFEGQFGSSASYDGNVALALSGFSTQLIGNQIQNIDGAVSFALDGFSTSFIESQSQGFTVGALSVVSTTPATPVNATALLEYRVSGSTTWITGPTPSIIGSTCYGMLWGLADGTTYDWRLTYTDSGPLNGQQTTGNGSVIVLPAENTAAATTTVSTEAQLTSALSSASPGDIIEVDSRIEVSSPISTGVAGTASQPIYLRGTRDGAIIRAFSTDSSTFSGQHSYWVVEDLIIKGNQDTTSNTAYTIRIGAFSGAVINGFTLRRCAIVGKRGVLARETNGQMTGFAIYDNTFTGVWSRYYLANLLSTTGDNTSLNVSWSDVAFRMTGQDHLIFNNTLSGYGDGAKTDEITALTNENIVYARNDILWGGDDGIELDDGEYNCIAYQNRISNTGTGVSRQPNGSPTGPMYAVENVLINQFLRPFKLNDGPPRIKLLHNTIVYTNRFTGDTGYLQFGSGAGNALDQIDHLNNLYVRADTPTGAFEHLDVKPSHSNEQYDGDAFYPDGIFRVEDSTLGNSFAAAQGNTTISGYQGNDFEDSGQLLGAQPFTNGIDQFGSDWETTVNDFDADYTASGTLTVPGFSSATPGHQNVIEYGRRNQNTALAQACAALDVGYSIRFADIPALTFRSTGTIANHFTNWASSAVYDPIRREVRFVGRAQSSQSPDQFDWYTYFEDTDTWERNPRPIFITNDVGHGYDHNACNPLTGDHYFKNFDDGAIHFWDGEWSQLPVYTGGSTPAQNSNRDATTLTYVPGLGLVHVGDGLIQYYDGASWNTITTASFLVHTVSEYNAKAHKMLYGAGNSGSALFVLNCDDFTTGSIATPPANFGSASDQGILVSDPASTQFVATRKANGLWWSYDVENDGAGWQSIPQSSGNGSTQQLGAPNLTLSDAKQAVALPEYGCMMFIVTDVSDESGEAWLYKHS